MIERLPIDERAAGVAVLAALLAAFAPADPTGSAGVDAILRAGAVGVVVVAAVYAVPWTWLLLGGVAAVSTFPEAAVAPASVATAIALVALATRRDDELFGAASAALATLALFHQPADRGFLGAPTIVAVVAVAPVLVFALAAVESHVRRRVLVALGVVAVAAGAVSGLSLYAAVDARTAVFDGASLAQQGLDALRRGEATEATALLRDAADRFDDANDTLGAPWVLPARLVPVVAQNARALDVASETGLALAARAADVAEDVDLDRLDLSGGRVPIEQLESFVAPARRAAEALVDASAALDDVESPWLLEPVATRVDKLDDAVEANVDQALLVADAVAMAPDLLGADARRTYFVMLGNPAEGRELGGLMGEWGLLHTSDGRLAFEGPQRVADLSDALVAGNAQLALVDLPASVTAAHPERFAQNWTASADLPTDAAVVRDLWRQLRDEPLAGVLYVDSAALGGLLQLTGPVSVPERPEPLTADTVVDFLLREQYVAFEEQSQRADFLHGVAEIVFQRLVDGAVPSPDALTTALGPAVGQRHLALASFDDREQEILDRLALGGRLPPVDGKDFLAVVEENTTANKLDAYVRRAVDYAVTHDRATGRVEATLTVSVHNEAPLDGLPDYVLGRGETVPRGTASSNIVIYSPHGVEGVEIDGVPATAASEPALGRLRHAINIQVPAGGTVVLTVRLAGRIATGRDYELVLVPHARAVTDALTVHLEGERVVERRLDRRLTVTEGSER